MFGHSSYDLFVLWPCLFIFSSHSKPTTPSVSQIVYNIMQALNFALTGAHKFLAGKGHLYEENLNLYWNFAQGIPAIAVGAVGYFYACM